MVENKAKSVSIFKVLLEPDYVGMENPSHQIALPHEWQSKQQGISVGIDMTLPLKAKIALNAKAAINANLQGENRYYRPQLGLGLRFRLMD